ncbi:MAG TPA: CsgG/HfaB family protein [Bacteroidota bacterium]
MKYISVCLAAVTLIFSQLTAQTKFYNYYDEGSQYMEKQDWVRAIGEFKSAASLEFEDAKRKRTYGTRFIEYFPHREIGIAHYFLGEFQDAKQELELSLAFAKSDRAEEFLDKVRRGISPALLAEEDRKRNEAERQRKLDEENRARREREEIEKKNRELAEKQRIEEEERKREEERKALDEKNTKLPVGALTYDPSRVTQVGSRLAIAVLPFDTKGEAQKLDVSVTDKLVTQLVNLRRFKVMERAALEKVLKEQKLQTSGVVDEKTAVNIGKIAGADAIVIGDVTIVGGFAKVSARVIDTETSETIVAKEEQGQGSGIEDVEKTVGRVAIDIYNELPIVEGYVVNQDQDLFYIDIGSEKGIRKGSKCVAFREGDKIRHPVTGEILGSRVTKLGELVVVQVQGKLAATKIVESEGEIKVGDKVVVK